MMIDLEQFAKGVLEDRERLKRLEEKVKAQCDYIQKLLEQIAWLEKQLHEYTA